MYDRVKVAQEERAKKTEQAKAESVLMNLLCTRIVDELFINGNGQRAQRLILELEDGKDGGGWCREAVKSIILKHINA